MQDPDRQDAPQAENPTRDPGTAEAKRVAARRRFLRMGAGGSTAILVTVVHKRAFAGGRTAKKGTVVSHCISIGGIPNIKGMDSKKALVVSAGGTLQGATCDTSKPPPANTCQSPLGGTTPVYGLVQSAKGGWKVQVVANVPVFSDKQMQNGCGDLEDMLNSPYQYNYRLYKKFYCPVRINGGVIEYYPPGTGTPNPYSSQLIDSKGKPKDPCADPDI